MATPREIKRRIRSVTNIAKVTGALEAVSASKVRRAQAQALSSRHYSLAAMEILQDLALHAQDLAHPLMTERHDVKQVMIILITSDRGLAGPYNTNVIQIASKLEERLKKPTIYIAVGKKGRDSLLRRGAEIEAEFVDMPASPSILDTTPITRAVKDDFMKGVVDEVYIAYTNFINTLRQEATIQRLLPFRPDESDIIEAREQYGRSGPVAVYSFEPDPQSVLDEVIPRFTELVFFQTVLEAQASEHSARMVAMRNATENANALVDELTLNYNNARQLAITSEMLDIVGGAEALGRTD